MKDQINKKPEAITECGAAATTAGCEISPTVQAEYHRRVYTDRMAELSGVIGSYLYYIRGRKRSEPCAALFLSITHLCDELRSLAQLELELEKGENGERRGG